MNERNLGMDIQLFRDEVFNRILLITGPHLRRDLLARHQPMLRNCRGHHGRLLPSTRKFIPRRFDSIIHIMRSRILLQFKHILQGCRSRGLFRRMNNIALEIPVGSLNDLDVVDVLIFDVTVDFHVEGDVSADNI